ncbi:hypothetical protein PMAYCL1PPCAC_20162, partial [Pristionchus mayeri]
MDAPSGSKRQIDEGTEVEAKRSKARDDIGDATVESSSPLENLPKELVWMIIDFARGSLRNLRMTSRLIKNIVEEFALQQGTSEIVEEVKTSYYSEGNSGVFSLDISLRVRNYNSQLLEFRMFLRNPSGDLTKQIRRDTIRKSLHLWKEYAHKFKSDVVSTEMVEFLREFLGKRIEKLTRVKSIAELGVITELLKEVHFKILEVDEIATFNNSEV